MEINTKDRVVNQMVDAFKKKNDSLLINPDQRIEGLDKLISQIKTCVMSVSQILSFK